MQHPDRSPEHLPDWLTAALEAAQNSPPTPYTKINASWQEKIQPPDPTQVSGINQSYLLDFAIRFTPCTVALNNATNTLRQAQTKHQDISQITNLSGFYTDKTEMVLKNPLAVGYLIAQTLALATGNPLTDTNDKAHPNIKHAAYNLTTDILFYAVQHEDTTMAVAINQTLKQFLQQLDSSQLPTTITNDPRFAAHRLLLKHLAQQS